MTKSLKEWIARQEFAYAVLNQLAALEAAVRTFAGETPPIFLRPIENVGLTPRTVNALKAEGIIFLGDLVQRTKSDLLLAPNLNRRAINEIIEVIEALGLSLGMKLINYWPDIVRPG